MALVDGGKQRAISVDYPVYYSPGACLDILNGFMADAGDPALGGGGRRRGGSGGAAAPPLGQPEQRPEPPEGTRGPWEGAQNAPRGNPGRGGVSRHPAPTGAAPRRLCRVAPAGDFSPRVQSLWESRAARGWRGGRGTERSPEPRSPGGQRDTDTPAGPAPAAAGALGPRSAIS